ncbi:hypothetical protein FQP81_18355 [Pseudoalteromonas distincta]|uniref:hypothetical protein n=1 Tax=Pseudoalteromonas distincta TaxID=77608 RepID=UPI00119742FA|nr:hypothetical protein [Pseudoalteromonas elyakovii]TVU70419.1 hypothetical protein FQP81_18355 [Pseudoalteromonas elyakovii]
MSFNLKIGAYELPSTRNKEVFMSLNREVIKSFANTIVEVDIAIVTNSKINFDSFINKIDEVCWLALSKGDVVPELYVNMIDDAFLKLSSDHKGKYRIAYDSAVLLHNAQQY